MTRTPDFDEIVGTDLAREERERLEHVHDLLVIAGPPAELAPELERGPTLAMTLGGPRNRHVARRVMLLAAAIMVVLLVFLGGYVTGNKGGGGLSGGGRTLKLVGTAQAPTALASLHVASEDAAGNLPMTISATGLAKLPAHGYYEVYLTRNGKIWAPCGTFRVASATSAVSVELNAPYDLRRGDSWVVTRQMPGHRDAGPVVLAQQAA
jgi:hypothetical protein